MESSTILQLIRHYIIIYCRAVIGCTATSWNALTDCKLNVIADLGILAQARNFDRYHVTLFELHVQYIQIASIFIIIHSIAIVFKIFRVIVSCVDAFSRLRLGADVLYINSIVK